MLDCHACFWPFIRAISNDTPYNRILVHGQQFVAGRSVLIAPPSYSIRKKSTAAVRDNAIQRRDARHHLRLQSSLQSLGQVRKLRTDAVKPPYWSAGVEDGPPSTFSKSLYGHVSRELPWLKDPLRLADRIRTLLEQGKEEKALALVRLASRNTQCQISWNAIISYYLKRKNLSVAWAIFNEVRLWLSLKTKMLISFALADEEASTIPRFLYVHNNFIWSCKSSTHDYWG
jgi:pentatricopeptide repeat protein